MRVNYPSSIGASAGDKDKQTAAAPSQERLRQGKIATGNRVKVRVESKREDYEENTKRMRVRTMKLQQSCIRSCNRGCG